MGSERGPSAASDATRGAGHPTPEDALRPPFARPAGHLTLETPVDVAPASFDSCGGSAHRTPPVCCAPKADARIARSFDDRWADTDEPPEMVGVSARLLDLMRDAPLRQPSVLELGCGPGALSVALLEMGATHVTGVDLSAASVELARRRAAAAGFGERARYEVGNAADIETESQDWVILDRVICCFPDMDRLVRHAAPLAGSAFLLSVPESRGWRGLVNRVLWGIEAAWDTLRGGCQGYVHDVRRLERRLAESGLRRTGSLHLGLWYLARYEHS